MHLDAHAHRGDTIVESEYILDAVNNHSGHEVRVMYLHPRHGVSHH
jgi:hypothetical protein